MKRVILIPTVFLVLMNTGDADALEALVKEATGGNSTGFEFKFGDNSVDVTVTGADGSTSITNVPPNGAQVIVYNSDAKTWTVEDGASYAAKTVEYNPPAPTAEEVSS